jgi:hypothetical protein
VLFVVDVVSVAIAHGLHSCHISLRCNLSTAHLADTYQNARRPRSADTLRLSMTSALHVSQQLPTASTRVLTRTVLKSVSLTILGLAIRMLYQFVMDTSSCNFSGFKTNPSVRRGRDGMP